MVPVSVGSLIPDGITIPSRRVADLVEEFSAFGARPDGGITRLAASKEDGLARDRLAELLREAGANVFVDPVGNQFGMFNLCDKGRATEPIMMGSHLDSQPNGGRIDGTLGVVSALVVAQLLMSARQRGHRFERDFCLVNWTNEEGARFRPSLFGSGYAAGRLTADEALSVRDDDGISLDEALIAIGYRGHAEVPRPAAYVEIHAEQGRRLENAGRSIGIVTHNWGAAKFEITALGEQSHTGPTPMDDRRDALLAASHVVIGLRQIANRWPGVVHTSVGRQLVFPNSANVVPDRVTFSAEIRSDDPAVLAEAERAAQSIIQEAEAATGVRFRVDQRSLRDGRRMPAEMIERLEAASRRAGHEPLRMGTVAGHDAIGLLGYCPTGLVFVPSVGGVAHNAAEATSVEDMDAGLAVLAEAAFDLCGSAAEGDPLNRPEGSCAE